jgi:hypothetical protein
MLIAQHEQSSDVLRVVTASDRRQTVKLARIIFIGAGIWGLTVLTTFYWLVDITGRHYVAPTEYPQFFYGFIAVALTWQVAFLLIGTDPARFRLLMIPAMIEKFSYVLTLTVLFAVGRISSLDFQPAVPDGLIGLLFVLAFVKTRGLRAA